MKLREISSFESSKSIVTLDAFFVTFDVLEKFLVIITDERDFFLGESLLDAGAEYDGTTIVFRTNSSSEPKFLLSLFWFLLP